MTAFLASLGFVVLAEMGDRTQLLAMASATRYQASTARRGVSAATVRNHFLAVLAGNYLTNLVPIHYVQIAAAASFILFGLWTIRGDELAGEDKRYHFSPFWTVAVAFFIAEMGDKTQLATVALAAKYQSVIPVLVGTTAGMLIADAIGIGIGIVMGKKIPERAVKWIAALIFIGFGIWGLYEYLPEEVLTVPAALSGITAVALAVYWLGRSDLQRLIGQAQAVLAGNRK
jgi:putative Ca2+/H+ antiporter (TMEM165/GDT1 family)